MAKKLSPIALERLFRRPDVKEIIAEELGLSDTSGFITIRRWIKLNKPNGHLTCDAVIKILTRELKLTKLELLEDCKNGNPVKKTKANKKRELCDAVTD